MDVMVFPRNFEVSDFGMFKVEENMQQENTKWLLPGLLKHISSHICQCIHPYFVEIFPYERSAQPSPS